MSFASLIPNLASLSALRTWSFAAAWFVLALLGCISARTAHAQASWEYAPYEVQIWVALPDDPTWQAANFEQLRQVLLGRAETTFGALWNCAVEPAPPAIASDVRVTLPELTVEQVQGVVPAGFKADKIYLVGVADEGGNFRIRVRELDYRARQFGMIRELETPQRDALPWQIWDGVAQTFTPLARIERVDKFELTARIKAGGLITDENSAGWIRSGTALRPVLRRNDRFGEPMDKGINLVAWTMLEVLEQNGPLLKCKLHTGYRSPIPAKSTARTERLALLVQPQFPTTTLHLRAQDKDGTPLVGYEVWRKTTGVEGVLIGRTDWRGDIELPQADTGELQTLLIKSGGQLLARLPLVPGQQPRMEASVVNDDERLQAEGFLQSFQSRIMDLEARRQITAARLRGKIKEKKFDEAQQLLEDFRNIEGREQMKRVLDQTIIKSKSGTTQKRVDKLMVDANTLLFKFLDPNMGVTLQSELLQAKAGKTPTTPANPATKPATTPATNPTPAPQPTPPMPTPPMPVPTPMPMPNPGA